VAAMAPALALETRVRSEQPSSAGRSLRKNWPRGRQGHSPVNAGAIAGDKVPGGRGGCVRDVRRAFLGRDRGVEPALLPKTVADTIQSSRSQSTEWDCISNLRARRIRGCRPNSAARRRTGWQGTVGAVNWRMITAVMVTSGARQHQLDQ
jgi:hypothetical protein